MMYTNLGPLLFVALVTLETAWADYSPLYISCIDASYRPAQFTTLAGITDSPDDCARACYGLDDGPFTYSLYTPGTFTRKRDENPACLCTNEATPLASYEVSDTGLSDGSCGVNQQAYYTTASTYAFEQCYASTGSSSSDYVTTNEFTNPQDCLQYCKSYEAAVMYVNTDEEPYMQCLCQASDTLLRGQAQACGLDSSQVYTHEADSAISSQFARRQLKERLIRAQAARKAICPKPLTACKISHALSDSFECVDTRQELDSCGGCAQGAYNTEVGDKEVLGVDCSTLPGIAKGGVTCSSGECVAFACKKGWFLSKGICVHA